MSVTAGYGVSKSSAGVPEAFVGSASITVENAIEVSVGLAGTVSACQQIPIPNLGIPGIAGFYFVVGGSIEADVTLTITIHAGTYSLSGGFMPGSNPGDLRGVTMDSECVDDDGNPVDECVTTEFSAALTGTLTSHPCGCRSDPTSPTSAPGCPRRRSAPSRTRPSRSTATSASPATGWPRPPSGP